MFKILSDLKELIKSEPHKKEIDKIIQRIPPAKDSVLRDSWILSNIKEEFIGQIRDIIKEDIDSMIILCPYFSEKRKFYEEILSYCKKLRIIVQNKKNNLPINELKGLRNTTYQEIKLQKNRYLHSKLIVFLTNDYEYILSGSANFSSSALQRTSRNGNVEICVLSKLEKGCFNNLIAKVGTLKPIDLGKIESSSISESDSDTFIECRYHILEALIKENRIIVKLDKPIGNNKVNILFESLEKDYLVNANNDIITFKIPEDAIPLFNKTSSIRLKIGNEYSDYKLLHNPSFFPEQFHMLNSIDTDDRDWLFSLLNKLSKMANFNQYIPILDKLDEYGAFDYGVDREEILLGLRKKLETIKPYSHTERLSEVIQRFIKKHKNRVTNAIKSKEYKGVKEVINSFLLTNKLVLWAVKNKYDHISGLRHIKTNMEGFLGMNDKGYIPIILANNLLELIIESNLLCHCLLQVFIIDLLQNNSPEIRDTYIERLNYSPLKRTFESSNIWCLNKIYNIQNANINRVNLEEIKGEYENIIVELEMYTQ